MTDHLIPPEFRTIFDEVFEDGDRVLAITPEGDAIADLQGRAAIISAADFQNLEDAKPCEAVFCLDILAGQPAESVTNLVNRLGGMVRPGGLLFLTAWSVDHPAWKNPEAGWERRGSRQFHNRGTGENRFFLYDDEIITIFAAWNVMYHQEGEDGLIETVLLKPEGRLVDVSTALYEG